MLDTNSAQQPAPGALSLAVGRIKNDPVTAMAALFILLLCFCAVFASWVSPYDPLERVGAPVQPPSGAWLLGTDEIGRDILSRLIHGSRISLLIGVTAPLFALVVGTPWGLVSGYFGGITDSVSMRIVDGLLAFPGIILAMASVAVLGPSLRNLVIAIGIVYTPRFARLVRGEVLRIKQFDFVRASVASGARTPFILRKVVLPNVVPVLSVQFTLSFATAVLTEAGLSYLGLGTQPPTASWGAMLSAARSYITMVPSYSIVSGGAIFLTVLSMSLIGDALRDVVDPRSSGLR